MSGRVSLVGAGPGDPDLWTIRARQRVAEADLVLYDALVDADALRSVTQAPCFCVGKRAGRASVRQETIHRLLVRAARQGKHVVRLKGGDPFVFGRGAEEALALAREGIACEIVPGVTTAVAAPALAGIPVTHRGLASGFLVLAGHQGAVLDEMLGAVRPGGVTLVVMMGLASRTVLTERLIDQGWSAATPVAIVCGATTPAEWIWSGVLEDLPSAVPPAGVAGVIVVGRVVEVRTTLAAIGAGGTHEDGVDAGTAAAVAGTGADEVQYGRSG